MLRDHNPFPKLDEYVTPKKITLGLSIDVQDVLANWDMNGTFKGFIMKFLEGLALKFEKEEIWNVIYALLDLLIHGIIIFLNIDNFVDHMDVEVFLSGNPMPFLLADIYSALHTHHEKRRGTLLCRVCFFMSSS